MESNVQRLLTKLTIIAALIMGINAGAWAAGNADAGKDLVAACGACHGADGATGLDPTYPNLAGQNEKYLYDQLKMIQDKTRDIALMAGQLDGRSDQDLADMAAYYASLPAKVSQASGDDDAIAQAGQIYRAGIARKGVAACAACHGPSGSGNAQAGFPALSGQPAAYTAAQLKAYREGVRVSDDAYGGMMRGVAEGLTDTEIALLSDYIQGLN